MGIHYNIKLDLSFSITSLYFVVVYNDDLIVHSVFIDNDKSKDRVA